MSERGTLHITPDGKLGQDVPFSLGAALKQIDTLRESLRQLMGTVSMLGLLLDGLEGRVRRLQDSQKKAGSV